MISTPSPPQYLGLAALAFFTVMALTGAGIERLSIKQAVLRTGAYQSKPLLLAVTPGN